MKTALKELVEKVSRLGQPPVKEDALPVALQEKLQFLRHNGYVILDHLVGSKSFAKSVKWIKQSYEERLSFRTPCLAQNRIHSGRDADLIACNFRASAEELDERGLLFYQDDVCSYDQVINDFAPSTLTLDMPSDNSFYDLWLDVNVMSIITAYMGFTPVMREAFVRRNFPCTYSVMNHKWHRDTNHRLHLLKAFIFFTDCDLETGAHHYVPKSIYTQEFRDRIYYDDDEVNAVFPSNEGKQMISRVTAGTIILEDTRGLHKAGIPQRDFRDLGFSVFVPPSFLHSEKPHYSIDQKTYDALSPRQKSFIPSRYITR